MKCSHVWIPIFLSFWAAIASSQMLNHNDYRSAAGKRVVVSDDSTQSYMLYIPTSAPANGPCPILYGFDPGANGAGALQYMAAAAAKMGWIVAASNNSKNGSWADIITAEQAIIRDTEKRLNLHPTRRFAAGMSGGARASLALAAQFPGKVNGVIAMGAGDPNVSSLLPHDNRLAVYMLIGNQDSNIEYDVPTSHVRMLSEGIRSYVEIFNGGHVMPPADRFLAACSWVAQYADNPPDHLSDTSDETAFFAQDARPNFANGWYTYLSQADANNIVLDDFTRMNAPIKQVGWWGLEASQNNDESWDSCTRSSLRFRINFYQTKDQVPGELVASRTVTATRETTGYLYNIFPLYRYTAILDQPVDLESGWISIGSLDTTSCKFYWLQGQSDGYNAIFSQKGQWQYLYFDMAFYLSPETDATYNRTLYEAGDTIHLRVPGALSRNSSFSWFFNGFPLTNDVRIHGADQRDLVIDQAALSDTGKYTCTYDNGRNQKADAVYGIRIQVVDAVPIGGTAGLCLLAFLLALAACRKAVTP